MIWVSNGQPHTHQHVLDVLIKSLKIPDEEAQGHGIAFITQGALESHQLAILGYIQF